MIQTVDDKGDGFVTLLGMTVVDLRTHFDAVGRVDHDQGHIGRKDAGHGLTGEIIQPGGVDEVDLMIFVFGIKNGGKNGTLLFQLYGIVVGHGIFLVHTSFSVDHPTGDHHRFGQGRLPGPCIPQ